MKLVLMKEAREQRAHLHRSLEPCRKFEKSTGGSVKVKLFCQGTASVRQWKRIRDKRDNLSPSRIKACLAHL